MKPGVHFMILIVNNNPPREGTIVAESHEVQPQLLEREDEVESIF
jgi:hypothetical protein